MKKFIALLLALLMVVSCLAACSKSEQAAEKSNDASVSESEDTPVSSGKTRATSNGKAENALNLAIGTVVSSLDPQLFTASDEDLLLNQIYSTLFYPGEDGSTQLELLESMNVNDDGSVSMVLRSDATFHSGDPVKAEDVEYTLSRCMNSAIASPLYGTVVLEIEDDTHFTMTFPAADAGANFDTLATYLGFLYICNKSFCETVISDPNDSLEFNEDGSGPYTFVSKDVNGDVVLAKYDGYFGEVNIDTLYFKAITGNREAAFEAGDIDFSTYAASTYELIKDYDNVTGFSLTLNQTAYGIVNCLEGTPTADLRVRQAIAYCMNREDLAYVISEGAGSVAYSMFNPMTKYYADVADHYEMDVEKANELMAEAGYSESNKLELDIITLTASAGWVAACEVLKEELEQSYFTVTITEVADMTRYFSYDFGISILGISLPATTTGYSVLFDTPTGMNLCGLEDPELLAMFLNTADEASAQACQKAATETLAYLPLAYGVAFYAADADLVIGDYHPDSTNWDYCSFAWK